MRRAARVSWRVCVAELGVPKKGSDSQIEHCIDAKKSCCGCWQEMPNEWIPVARPRSADEGSRAKAMSLVVRHRKDNFRNALSPFLFSVAHQLRSGGAFACER